ncbi:hypothetical protein OAO94_06675, partial [Flavobacteriaceae bacterium]|nr:hypothetical protein [Flavobacteriaceae bacterium]
NNLNLKKIKISLVLLLSLLQNIYISNHIIYKEGSIIEVLKVRNELSSLILRNEIPDEIFTFSGIFTSGISSFNKLQDSGIFYPRLANTLGESTNFRFNNYYQTLIYPHENLNNLPSVILHGFYKGQTSEDTLIESYSKRYKTKRVVLNNSFNVKSISLLLRQNLE